MLGLVAIAGLMGCPRQSSSPGDSRSFVSQVTEDSTDFRESQAREPASVGVTPSENQPNPVRSVSPEVPVHSDPAVSQSDTSVQLQTEARAGAIPPETIDAGSERLVLDIIEAIGEPASPTSGVVIVVRDFRNQSRTPGDEMAVLRERIHRLLAAAGEPRGLRITLDPSAECDYTLGGTVYLVNRDGFDQWEIYFALRPAEANWTIWRNDDPVRMMRQQRAAGDALMVAPRR